MSPDDFLRVYEKKINLHCFDEIAPLVARDAVFWFNDGSYVGIEAIRHAFEKTWQTLKDEVYWLEEMRWVAVDDLAASCIYRFCWTCNDDGRLISGSGRGTTILRKDEGVWLIVHEHLSRFPKQA